MICLVVMVFVMCVMVFVVMRFARWMIVMLVSVPGGGLLDRLGVFVEQVETFDVDEQGAIVGSAGGLQHAHDLEGVMLVSITGVGESVRGLELVSDLEARPAGHGRADDGFEEMLVLEVATARLEGVFLAAGVLELVEQLGDGADDAKALVIVPQAIRDRRLHKRGEFARRARDVDELFVKAVGDVFDRVLQVIDGVQHQLQLASLFAHDQVISARAAGERIAQDPLRHQHGDNQRDAKGDTECREGRGQGPLFDAAQAIFQRLMRAPRHGSIGPDDRCAELLADLGRVGHQDQGHVLFGAGIANQIDDLLLMPRIDIGRGLIGQQQLGPIGQGAGDGDALLLAHGKHGRLVPQPVRQADVPSSWRARDFVRAAAGEAHAQQDILEGREAGEQIEGLKHVADMVRAEPVAAVLGKAVYVAPRDLDQPRVGAADTGDHVQQRCLATAAASDQGDLLAGRDVKLGDVQNRQLAAVGLPIRFLKVLE